MDMPTVDPIVIDGPAQRKFLTELDNYPGMSEQWYKVKLFMFAHHLDAHLEIEDIDPHTMTDKTITALAHKYPDEWVKISERMDIHRARLVMAIASMFGETMGLDPHKDNDLIMCNAYDGVIVASVASQVDTYRSVLAVKAKSIEAKRSLTDPRNAEMLISMIQGQTQRFYDIARGIAFKASEFYKRHQ